MKPILNRAKCAKCGKIIESKSAHDFVRCKCGAIAVDGGPNYRKRMGDKADFLEVEPGGEIPLAGEELPQIGKQL